MTAELDKWDDRFLLLARHISSYSKDPSTKVGAVIARGNTIVSMGFNGLPHGVGDEDVWLQARERKLQVMLHAELNAVLFARQPVKDCTLYVWPFQPCSHCASVIVQSGIRRVVTTDSMPERWSDSFILAKQLMESAGVETVKSARSEQR
jgi:dCMP deaminase